MNTFKDEIQAILSAIEPIKDSPVRKTKPARGGIHIQKCVLSDNNYILTIAFAALTLIAIAGLSFQHRFAPARPPQLTQAVGIPPFEISSRAPAAHSAVHPATQTVAQSLEPSFANRARKAAGSTDFGSTPDMITIVQADRIKSLVRLVSECEHKHVNTVHSELKRLYGYPRYKEINQETYIKVIDTLQKRACHQSE